VPLGRKKSSEALAVERRKSRTSKRDVSDHERGESHLHAGKDSQREKRNVLERTKENVLGKVIGRKEAASRRFFYPRLWERRGKTIEEGDREMISKSSGRVAKTGSKKSNGAPQTGRSHKHSVSDWKKGTLANDSGRRKKRALTPAKKPMDFDRANTSMQKNQGSPMAVTKVLYNAILHVPLLKTKTLKSLRGLKKNF